jgi:hypothetical protein
MDGLEPGQSDLKGLHLVGVGHNQGVQEIVPQLQEGKDRQHSHRRRAHRQQHSPVDLEVVRPIDARRFVIFLGHGDECLAHEECAEHVRAKGQPEGPIGIDQVQLGEEQEDRDDHHLVGHHDLEHHQPEDGITTGEVLAGKAIRGQRAGDDLQQGAAGGDDQAVKRPANG